MANAFGEGDAVLLSGSLSATTPLTLCDFSPNDGGNAVTTGPDGFPCNSMLFFNCDTSSTYVLHVRATGLHQNATGSAMTIPPGANAPLQLSLNGNDITKVVAWPSTFGDGTFSGSIYVCGGVMGRRA